MKTSLDRQKLKDIIISTFAAPEMIKDVLQTEGKGYLLGKTFVKMQIPGPSTQRFLAP